LPWEKLVLFSEKSFCCRGDYLIFLEMLIEDEETRDDLEPFEESRLQTLLEGWLLNLRSLLNDWRHGVSTLIEKNTNAPILMENAEAASIRLAPIGWGALAVNQLEAFLPLTEALDSFAKCKKFGPNTSFRDSEHNLNVVAAINDDGEPKFTNRKEILEKLVQAFRSAPSIDELELDEEKADRDDPTVYTWMPEE
jgi:hypothetical protein